MLLLFMACLVPPETTDSGATATWSGLSVKGQSACAFEPDGALLCWGPAAAYSESLAVKSIAVGNFHSCGLDTEGAVHCAGHDNYGESTPPTLAMRQVVVGDFHSCGLDLQGAVHCWGTDQVPSELPEGTYTQLSMAGYQLCGLDSDGALHCTDNSSLSCGNEPPPSGRYVDLDQSSCHGCALDQAGSVDCWNATPEMVPPGTGWLEIATGEGFTCALDSYSEVHCFGQAAPEPLRDHPMHDLDAGEHGLICGLDDQGMLCWGQSAEAAGMP